MATVLVVEDSADLREMYQEILAIEGHVVVTTESVAEALAAAKDERPQVVVLDLGIAGDVGRLVAELGPGAKVILASGARDLPERAAALGAAFLLKPFAPEQLLGAVATAVKRKGG
jgi:DNA-binding NtrC family response regulator